MEDDNNNNKKDDDLPTSIVPFMVTVDAPPHYPKRKLDRM